MTIDLLRVEGLKKNLGGKEILRGISFHIHPGEIKVLIGPSGGGKSTLLKCLNCLYIPDSGTLWFHGEPVDIGSRHALRNLRTHVGMVFQEYNLFDHMTALGNVSVALRKVKRLSKNDARERAQSELERIGLGEHVEKYPAELSGGQKQRVSIARALAMDPSVLLLDEPTAALDPELIAEVLGAIRTLADGGMTMVMATHQLMFARSLADELLFVEGGRITEQGPPDELLAAETQSRTRAFYDRLRGLANDGDAHEPR